jgi:hypothetical protein
MNLLVHPRATVFKPLGCFGSFGFNSSVGPGVDVFDVGLMSDPFSFQSFSASSLQGSNPSV